MSIRDRLKAGTKQPPRYEVWGERIDGGIDLVANEEDYGVVLLRAHEVMGAYRAVGIFKSELLTVLPGGAKEPRK